MLSLPDLFKLQCVKLMYKKVNSTLHSYHTSKLATNFEITQKDTRQKDNVYVKTHDNNFLKINSINYKVGMAWNELTPDIKEQVLKTPSTFTKIV